MHSRIEEEQRGRQINDIADTGADKKIPPSSMFREENRLYPPVNLSDTYLSIHVTIGQS